jgi:hypothetical protein
MTESDLEKFYKVHKKEVEKHCKKQNIHLPDIEMFTSSENPRKVTYKYKDKIILTAECELQITYRIRRYQLQ